MFFFHSIILAQVNTQTEAQIDSPDELADQSPDQDSESISKSQLKRDSKDLQRLGKKLARYNEHQLARIPMDETLKDAIDLAHRLENKRAAQKRHFQFIGKLLRKMDVEPIIEAVDRIDNEVTTSKQVFKQIEYWRDQILEQGDAAINLCCQQFPQMNRQKLRQLSRHYKQSSDDARSTRLARQLFQELQHIIRAE